MDAVLPPSQMVFFYVRLDDRGRVQWLGVMSSGHKPSGRRLDLETPGRWGVVTAPYAPTPPIQHRPE